MFVFSTQNIQAASVTPTQNFLVISDIHLNTTTDHRMDFAPRNTSVMNDLDVPTYKKLIYSIDQNIQSGVIAQPQFIVLLGDLVGHIRTSKQSSAKAQQIVFETLKEAFPDTPIFYNFGNNDSLQKDYGPFRMIGPKDPARSPLDIIRKIWPSAYFLSSGINCSLQQTKYPCLFQSKTLNGYYSAYLAPQLRLISLNSVMFSSHSKQTEESTTRQFEWLQQQLAAAATRQESVLILAHIPPGFNVYRPRFWSSTAFWKDDALDEFLSLIHIYRRNIIGILSAHTHKDELKVIQDTNENIVTGIYMNAALSTSHGNAPSIRSYTLEQSQDSHWHLMNYHSYYFIGNEQTMTIRKLYDYRKVYCQEYDYDMTDCLEHMNTEKMQSYFSAGNVNYIEKIQVPEYMKVYIPRQR